ncbi:MAG: LCP family protein [Lachnospiraceae bacterium]|nr:LCP family protein [Lachnospiraceae bacterium]
MANKKSSKAERIRRRKRKQRLKIVLFTIELLFFIMAIFLLSVFLLPNSKAVFVKMFTKCPAGQSLLKALYKDDYDKNVLDNSTSKNNIHTVDLGKGYTNIALFGIDPRLGEFEDSTHTDTIMIVSINNKTHDVKLVSVYRDTLLRMAKSNGDIDYEKANTAYFMNGAEGALNMLNSNFDLDITEYALVNFEGLANIIDALGGIDINLTLDEQFYVNGYLTETRKITGMDAPDVLTYGENTHLSGLQATAYCRIRYVTFTDAEGNEYHNDYGRTARQRYVLNTLLQKAKSAGINELLNVADTLIKKNNVGGHKIISTNISWDKIVTLLTVAVDCNLTEAFGFPYDVYTPEQGRKYYGYVIPMGLEQNVTRLHKQLFPGKSYVPSDLVTRINDYIIDETGIEPPEEY